MAKSGTTNISGGGGIGSDELSATKKQVLKGKTYVGADTNDEIGIGELDLGVITATSPAILEGKVGVDKDGNPIAGTMPDLRKPTKIRYWRYNNNRLEVAVDYGLHGSSWADNCYEYLEFADIGIEPWKFRADTTIAGVQGGIPIQNPDVSGTDRVRATGMSNWAGTINLQIRNWHFLNGVNWIQQDIPNYQPWNIKNGVDIGGVIGTFPDYSYLANGQTSF